MRWSTRNGEGKRRRKQKGKMGREEGGKGGKEGKGKRHQKTKEDNIVIVNKENGDDFLMDNGHGELIANEGLGQFPLGVE